jgi:hypothetical protein
LVVLATIIFTIFLVDSENQIEQLNKDLDIKQFTIDSLQSEIDTLEWKNEIWDFNIKFSTSFLLSAIIEVESSDNDSAYNGKEDAVGCLQIRRCMVDDVNRILKKQNKESRFYYQDRWNRNKSIQMFDVYCSYYNLNTAQEIARCWNGGPRGGMKQNTLNYWAKVENKLGDIYALR